jgi:hypothetical protein
MVMRHHHVGAVPVVVDGDLVGIMRDRNLVVRRIRITLRQVKRKRTREGRRRQPTILPPAQRSAMKRK